VTVMTVTVMTVTVMSVTVMSRTPSVTPAAPAKKTAGVTVAAAVMATATKARR